MTRREKAQELRRQRNARTAAHARPMANLVRAFSLIQYLRRAASASAAPAARASLR